MKKITLLFAFLLMVGAYSASAQVGIGAEPDPSAQLDISADDKGLLIPRIALTGIYDESTINNGNVESLLVYNTTSNTEVTPGYYYWSQGKWRRMITDQDALVPPASIPAPSIGTGNLEGGDQSISIVGGEGATLTSAQIMVKDEGISSGKLAPNAVTTQKIEDKAITLGKIAPGLSNGQILTTINGGGELLLDWQDPQEESVTSLNEEEGKLIYTDENGTPNSVKAVMPKSFFMPSVPMNVNPGADVTMNLYEEYRRQFTDHTWKSPGAKNSIPVLGAEELEYHITYYDDTVFEIKALSEDGVLTYTVKNDAPVTAQTFMNIVFVVK